MAAWTQNPFKDHREERSNRLHAELYGINPAQMFLCISETDWQGIGKPKCGILAYTSCKASKQFIMGYYYTSLAASSRLHAYTAHHTLTFKSGDRAELTVTTVLIGVTVTEPIPGC
jgi:hypothetical protein